MAGPGILQGIRIDVVRLHETWMELVFPRQRSSAHNVLGKWRPRDPIDKVKYRVWSVLGMPVVAMLYPLLLFGFFVRFNARRIDTARARLGVFGVIFLVAILWGVFTALTYLRLALGESMAVAAASVIAVVSAGIAALFAKIDGRLATVIVAYPMAVNALFLPPVVAALFDPSLSVVLERSTNLAIFLLDDVLTYPLSTYLRANYSLEGIGYVLMWTAIATPIGWFLGCVVTLADLIRPKHND